MQALRKTSAVELPAYARQAHGLRRQGGRAPALPAQLLIEQALHRLSRPELESLVEKMIARLDLMDGDPDLELHGDETDGTGAEDDYAYLASGTRLWGPGCAVSDAA